MNTAATAPEQRVSGCPFAGHGATTSPTTWSPVADAQQDQSVIEAIDRWTEAAAPDSLVLGRLVAAHVRAVGKHFLSEAILARLARIRDEHAARDRFLDAFLDSVLDKHDGRYGNRTYLALPLLEEICAEPGMDADRMSALLMGDVIRFEAHDADGRPNDLTRRKRINHALRFVNACGIDGLPDHPAGRAGDWFDLTVLPVYVVHDEYFFIRALQAHEMVYKVLSSDLGASTRALRAGSFEGTIARLDHANAVFARAAMLFRLVATMRPEQFHAFREYTEGASAIQSEAYKRFEIACGQPTDERLESDAFTNVPAVQAEAGVPRDELSQAYLDARRDGTIKRHEWDAIDVRLGDLEAGHQRWKITHHSLAVRMLGDATGSGYTSGVPYLKACMSNRLFRRLGAYLSGSHVS